MILADRDKVEMEEAIARQGQGPRSAARGRAGPGNPTDLDDLEVVNRTGRRAIIVLAETPTIPTAGDQDAAGADAATRGAGEEPYHIVAVIHDPDESRGGAAGRAATRPC